VEIGWHGRQMTGRTRMKEQGLILPRLIYISTAQNLLRMKINIPGSNAVALSIV